VDNITQAPPPLTILHEDEQLIALAKPAGLLTQPAPGEDDALTKRVRAHLGRDPGLVHRLDRPVSGVVVMTKEPKTTRWLNKCIREGKTVKLYVALVRTGLQPVACAIRERLHKVRAGKMTTSTSGQPAHTGVVPLAFDPQAEIALVGLRLFTGRTHQARVHLAAEFGAIVGDRKYGDVIANPRVALHATVIKLPGSSNTPERIITCAPDDTFWSLAGSADVRRDEVVSLLLNARW
jgi:23S rRNA-/tRNA-specific pseudouridylate synthase